MVADSGWQPLLWSGETGADGFAPWPQDARRYLPQGAWVDHVPGWYRDADELFSILRRDIDWRADRRQMFDRELPVPRLTAWFSQCSMSGVPSLERCRYGDLLVMGGACQRTWDHAVPKTRQFAGPRVSVQFRPTGVA